MTGNHTGGLVFVLSGPSGVGKTNLMQKLREGEPEMYFCITATTREPRPGEVNGVDYIFYSPEEFTRVRDENGFLEWANVPPGSPQMYGTPMRQVENALAEGKDVFLQVDVQGARSVRRRIPDAVLILLKPESPEVLRHRLSGRGMTPGPDLEARLKNALVELQAEPEFDYAVVNVEGRLEEAVRQVREIFKRERRRVPPRIARVDPPPDA